MAQAPIPASYAEFAARAGQGGPSLDDAHDNATNKQYDMRVDFKIVETANPTKPFYSAHSEWNGVSYGIVVVTEHEMIEVLKKFNALGGIVAVGQVPPIETTPPAK